MITARQIRVDLAAAYRLADRQGLNESINNHFTARVPDEEDRFVVIPHGQVLAQSTGQPLRFIPDEVAAGYVSESRPNNLAKQAREHFAALKRILDREEPDYTE